MFSYSRRFVSQAWRDLWRNRRRTILTGLAMVFASFSMVPFIALGDGGHQQMIESATDSFLGHGQIQHKGYRDDPDLFHRIQKQDLVKLREILNSEPGVESWSPRITTGALASKKVPEPEDPDDLAAYRDMSSEGVMLLGVDPARETEVSTLAESVLPDDPRTRCREGCRMGLAELYSQDSARCDSLCETAESSFQGTLCKRQCEELCTGQCPKDDEFCYEEDCIERCANFCEPARFLSDVPTSPDNRYRGEVVLGSELARLMEVTPGHEVAVTTSTSKGRTYGAIYRVVGLAKTNSTDINRTMAMTHQSKLATGLEITGGATSVILKVADIENAEQVTTRIESAFPEAQSHLVALSWKQLAPELEVFIKLDQGSLLIMLIILTLVVGVVIANVITMSVMERTREFGVRLALGESPSRIAWSLITEVMLLAFSASLLGALLGEALTVYLAGTGIDFGFGEMQSAGVLIQSVFYPLPTLYGFLFPLACVVGFSFLGALIPAMRMRSLQPADALRFE